MIDFVGYFELNPNDKKTIAKYRKMVNRVVSGTINLKCKWAKQHPEVSGDPDFARTLSLS